MMHVHCPALLDLFAEEREPEVKEHVAGCTRCRALLASQDERVVVDSVADSDWQTLKTTPTEGAVVLVSSFVTDEYLPAAVVKVDDETLTVIPLSEEVDLASEWDLLIDANVLGYEAMGEVWNFGTALTEQLADQIGELPGATLEQLRDLLRAAISSSDVPEKSAVGPPVLGPDDPRLLFHDEEAERVHVFWEPTLALAGAASLGQLVAHRREELAIPARQLESLASRAGWLHDFERDALDILRVLQPDVVASLLQQLRLDWSRRLRRIAEVTLEAHSRAADLPRGTTFARRRRGVVPRRRERTVREYLDEVERRLTSSHRK
jgi:hypothetical protein